uniref:Uncharacterized protein n=1 Tax=Dromaius novaehollandiae TaxID=8790 RepID=A0A8C4KKW5_DRONO
WQFPGGNDNYLAITGTAHPFLTGAETFHTPSLGDEEFEIPPIALDADPSLAVSDVVGHFDDLGDPGSAADAGFSAQYGVQALDMPVGMSHGLMEQGGGLLSGSLAMVRRRPGWSGPIDWGGIVQRRAPVFRTWITPWGRSTAPTRR